MLAAIHRFGGALLADPVGSGKTYVALAVALALNRGPTACLVPASLLAQWQTTADRFSIPVTLCSHEQISRGRLPSGTRGLVVIDESHHFRNPDTLRYQHLAPWLVGRAALLLSATPVVNRTMDLVHQLLLTVSDDALSLHGVPSLSGMLAGHCPHPALGQLIFEQELENVERPCRTYSSSTATRQEESAICRCIDSLNQLRLSRSAPIAVLIQGVLLRALASSPAAYISALHRYHGLLLHARDAEQAGHRPDRAALRRFIGDMADQLVFWELFSSTEGPSELELDDIGKLADLLADAAPAEADGKILRLRGLLSDGTPTLVFTAYRDTVGYLRRQLEDLGIAWCTGERAGIGRTTLPRQVVLNWFRDPTPSSLAPHHLVVTDVAAEGLDLPRAARVVHYDLPWTPMRLEQREGRSVRYGSSHATVEIVQFRLPPDLERRLGIEATLVRKERLPAAAGLGKAGRRLWRWRSELAVRFAWDDAREGVASVTSHRGGLLAGFAIGAPASGEASAATVLWLEADGSWTEAPEVIEAQLEIAAREPAIIPIAPDQLSRWLSLLATPIRTRLAFTRSRRWMVLEPNGRIRALVSRLQSGLKTAARRRDASQLRRLERAMTFVVGGHTAGEAALLERLVRANDSELHRLLPTLPSRRRGWEHLEVRLTGLILFRPLLPAPARVVSPECPGWRPHSSISMEP